MRCLCVVNVLEPDRQMGAPGDVERANLHITILVFLYF